VQWPWQGELERITFDHCPTPKVRILTALPTAFTMSAARPAAVNQSSSSKKSESMRFNS
jgi:hypothetical protein